MTASANRYRRNRILANGLLAGMGGIFVGTHLVNDPNMAVQLAQAASEAGLVGGIADWFAVTALFKRPLGLPIPHTAVIPRSKDRIADSIGDFIGENFLTAEIISGKLQELDVGRRFGAWLSKPENAAIVADAVVKALPYAIRSLGSSELRGFVDRLAGERIREADAAPITAKMLRALSTSRELDSLFDGGIDLAAKALSENRDTIISTVRTRSQWWIPGIVDKKIAEAIVDGMGQVVEKMREPDSEGRLRFRQSIAEFVESLETSPERRKAVNDAKNRMLDHPDVKGWVAATWTSATEAATADLESDSSTIVTAIRDGVGIVGRMIAEDRTLQVTIDRTLENVGLYLVAWRGEIGKFFSDVVRRWDSRTLTERLEQAVGSDLQFIRMNGTVVGAIVGCALFALTRILH